ncbi:phospholipid phosphatase [Aminobacter sp. AP02]|uniref:phospholipid phosphatase n=1 Tax=Aminobacter sp. AP02 TaxID=2135737 RepID=UPI0018EEAEB7|nr:phospholipid phosphatase [Aminobacter sp. AP02]
MIASLHNMASLNKHKSKAKNKNKNRGSALQSGCVSGAQSSLIPVFELRRMHASPSSHAFTAARKFTWEQLDIPLPPGPDVTRLETSVLLSLQARDRERSRRKEDIEREASLDVSDFTKPLGIDGIVGFEQTEGLILSILTACEYVGLIYKAKVNRTPPNQIEPRLRLMLPNPAHQTYPSNHSFKCHSIAFAFNAILPEHYATEELSRIARKIAENREWAGLHYPSDTNGGRALAQRFQPYLRDAFMASYLAAQREWL